MKYVNKICIVFGLCAITAAIVGFSYKSNWTQQQKCEISWLNNLQEGDTLRISYNIASGEFGNVHEALLIHRVQGKFKVDYIIYNYGIEYLDNGLIKILPTSILHSLEPDTLKTFFLSIKNDYKVIKAVNLDESQTCLFKDFFIEAANFKSQGVSNAPEYYFIDGNKKDLVIIDHDGKWNKQREIKEKLSL